MTNTFFNQLSNVRFQIYKILLSGKKYYFKTVIVIEARRTRVLPDWSLRVFTVLPGFVIRISSTWKLQTCARLGGCNKIDREGRIATHVFERRFPSRTTTGRVSHLAPSSSRANLWEARSLPLRNYAIRGVRRRRAGVVLWRCISRAPFTHVHYYRITRCLATCRFRNIRRFVALNIKAGVLRETVFVSYLAGTSMSSYVQMHAARSCVINMCTNTECIKT